jgi:hypothetical protein
VAHVLKNAGDLVANGAGLAAASGHHRWQHCSANAEKIPIGTLANYGYETVLLPVPLTVASTSTPASWTVNLKAAWWCAARNVFRRKVTFGLAHAPPPAMGRLFYHTPRPRKPLAARSQWTVRP